MGVKDLFRELPGSNMGDQRVGVLTLDILHGPVQRPADIDTRKLVIICSPRHKEVYSEGSHELAITTPNITAGG